MIAAVRQSLVEWDVRFKLASGLLLVIVIAFVSPARISMVIYYFSLSALLIFSTNAAQVLRGVLKSMLPLLLIFIAVPVFTAYLTSTQEALKENFMYGAMVGLKALSIVAVTLYLFHSSRFNRILGALDSWKIPPVILFLLMISHRYFYLFQKTVRELLQARSLRLFDRSHLRQLPSASVVLIRKALDHGEEVYIAMRLRGGENSLPLLATFQSARRDYILAGTLCILTLVPLILN